MSPPAVPDPSVTDLSTDADDALAPLARRIGWAHVRTRLALEAEYEQLVRQRPNHLFHFDAWYSAHGLIRLGLRSCGLLARAKRNARRLQLRREQWDLPGLPAAFDGYTLLHITDPHLDMAPDITDALLDAVRGLRYDACVLTGDYRARTFGSCAAVIDAMRALRAQLTTPVYAVLGNHDSIRLVPAFEAMDIRVLMNETVGVERDGSRLYLAGIDDAHYYRLEQIAAVSADIPPAAIGILLSHTPEVYRRAAAAGFRLMLCGHTHGGQICLPGGIPVLTDADCPRRYAKGRWRHRHLHGYTSTGSGSSIVDLRLNCPPEVTLHRLRAA